MYTYCYSLLYQKGGHVWSLYQMLTIPTLDIGVTSRAFLQDHRRKSYLQPINWSVLSSGDTPYVEPMETDDNGGAPEPGGVYGTSSSHLIGGNSTHSLSRGLKESSRPK